MELIKKLSDILSVSEKKNFLLLLLLVLFMSLLEILGVASILPFIRVLSDPEVITTNEILFKFYSYSNNFGISNIESFTIFLGLLFLFIFIFSLTFRACVQYFLIKYGFMRQYSISRKLLEVYVQKQYIDLSKINKVEFGKNILSEVDAVISRTIIPIITLITQIIVSISIICLLLFVDMQLTLISLIVFGLSYLFIFKISKKKITESGKKLLLANTDRYDLVFETFMGIKEIKLKNLELNYIKKFSQAAHQYAHLQTIGQTIRQLPKFLIEALAFGGMILISIVLLMSSENNKEVISILAIYALAGYRLMPAFQQIYGSSILIKLSKPSLEAIHQELDKVSSLKILKNNNLKFNFKKDLKLKVDHFKYDNENNFELRDINLSIKHNSKVAIVGKSGSGKSTIIDIILGFFLSENISLKVDGVKINRNNLKSFQNSIGYIPQQIFIKKGTILENIAFGVKSQDIDIKLVESAAKIANIHDFIIKDLPHKYDTFVQEAGSKLSGGQLQRLAIARALYNKPQILVFDEPTSSLDNINDKQILENVMNLNYQCTVIIVSHRLNNLKFCDMIFLIDKGRIITKGKYAELEKFSNNFKDLNV